MTFTKDMRKILESGEWLSDLHMSLAQEILQYQFPRIGGWQSTLLVQIDGFVPVQNDAIQIHLVSGSNWVTSSSVGQVLSVYDPQQPRVSPPPPQHPPVPLPVLQSVVFTTRTNLLITPYVSIISKITNQSSRETLPSKTSE